MVILAVVAGWVGWKYIQRQRFLKKIEVARITPQELRRKLEAGEDVFVIDLRGEREFQEHAIPGAMHMPADQLAERSGAIPRDRDIILFCS
jgi:rhodanese-related sulfurtransferase